MKPHVICLAIDRLRASALGPYGAAWCDTLAFDRLASESRLHDQLLCESLQLEETYRNLWGPSAGRNVDSEPMPASLPAASVSAGYQAMLLTDEPLIANHVSAQAFMERIVLQPEQVSNAADTIEETQIGHFFAAATDALRALRESSSRPTFLWMHCRGMAAPWDAPWKLRESLAEEGDPTPPRNVDVPSEVMPPDADPDIRLAHTQCYTAQVAVLDACLGVFLEQIEDLKLARETQVVVFGLRGFPLGEHGTIGAAAEQLYHESMHVPLFIREFDQRNAASRVDTLATHGDLRLFLAQKIRNNGQPSELLSLPCSLNQKARDRVCAANGLERAIRTPAWHLRVPGSDEGTPELYVKPDDRFEMNEIAALCPEIVARLQAAIVDTDAYLQGDSQPLAMLSDELISGNS
ncbi:MAG: sulfatase-like hydrolase/transferase [Planctomycetales bacterium]|nr:sulfatase-like hydrolase/transferase [Planctomycetales bacterium]